MLSVTIGLESATSVEKADKGTTLRYPVVNLDGYKVALVVLDSNKAEEVGNALLEAASMRRAKLLKEGKED